MTKRKMKVKEENIYEVRSVDVEGLKEVLREVRDPRRDYGNKRHKLVSVLAIALCSEICGGEGFDAMEEFGETRREWLATFLDLPYGTPCSDTFQRVLERLDSKELIRCLPSLDAACNETACDGPSSHAIQVRNALAISAAIA